MRESGRGSGNGPERNEGGSRNGRMAEKGVGGAEEGEGMGWDGERRGEERRGEERPASKMCEIAGKGDLMFRSIGSGSELSTNT